MTFRSNPSLPHPRMPPPEFEAIVVNHQHSGFHRATRTNRCPLCGRADWCLVSPDGNAVICPRTAEGATKDLGTAGYLHFLDDDRPLSLPAPKVQLSSAANIDWQELAERRQRNAEPAIARLAQILGVSQQSLRQLQVGLNPFNNTYTFPERDGSGKIVGITRRFANGDKKRIKGSKVGLTYSDDWEIGVGPGLLVEGASDTAALMTMGLTAIGRPSNRGGTALLADLLQHFPDDRSIIVLGENDHKPDGRCPGQEGAIATAGDLAKRLHRSIYWSMPPDQAKDAREWLNQHGGDNPPRMRDCFLEGLQLHEVQPPPTVRRQRDSRPTLPVDDYRARMLVERKLSVDRPAFYLDRSPTGIGKSTADLTVIQSLLVHFGGAA